MNNKNPLFLLTAACGGLAGNTWLINWHPLPPSLGRPLNWSLCVSPLSRYRHISAFICLLRHISPFIGYVCMAMSHHISSYIIFSPYSSISSYICTSVYIGVSTYIGIVSVLPYIVLQVSTHQKYIGTYRRISPHMVIYRHISLYIAACFRYYRHMSAYCGTPAYIAIYRHTSSCICISPFIDTFKKIYLIYLDTHTHTHTHIQKQAFIKNRDVNEYRMIRMIGIPKEYGRYMHQYTYSMHIC